MRKSGGKMASRKTSDLHKKMRDPVQEMLKKAEEQGIHLLITCTYRSEEEQDTLYLQGRNWGGRIITNARGGQSPHNATLKGKPASFAVDVVPIVNGKPYWRTEGEGATIWKVIGAIGEAAGLEWSGRWKGRLKELGHFQLKNWQAERG
jgi:peptidoglycan L-alanyl-D-glutamate endopeptidase CwlK